MKNIDAEELKRFIDEHQEKEMTSQEISREEAKIKYFILVETKSQLNAAFEYGNSAMVAALAEILKALS